MTSVATDLAPTVSPREVGEQLRAGRRVRVIDVRTRPEYDGLHAEGAELFPLDGLDLAAVTAGGGDEPLYVICKSGARSANACARFRAAGYGNVFSVEGGTDAWEAAGLPVVRGGRDAVMPIERQVRIAAGSLVLIGVVIGWRVHPGFYGLSAFVGAGLVFAGLTDWCGMGMLLARMPWNR